MLGWPWLAWAELAPAWREPAKVSQLHPHTHTPAHLPFLCSLEEEEERERGVTPVYVKYDARLYGPRKPGQKVGGSV